MLTPGAQPDPGDRRLERAGRLLAGSFGALGIAVALALLTRPLAPLDILVALLVCASAGAALLYWRAAGDLELRRRGEVEGFARILQGLSRSISPDAIVEAIAEELGVAAGADHVVVVRLRPNSGLLEATLVTNRAGVPSSTTVLPLSDLEDPLDRVRTAIVSPVAVGPGPADAPLAGLSGPGWDAYEPVAYGSPVAAPASTQAADSGRSPSPAGWTGKHAVFDDLAETADLARTAASGRLEASLPRPARETRPGIPTDTTAPMIGASLEATDVRFDPGNASVSAGRAGGTRLSSRQSERAADRIGERIATRVRAVFGLKHTIVAPLVPGGVVVGAIVLSRRTGDTWPAASGRLLDAAAVEASAALARAYSHRAAEERAATDALTGLPNRRYFDEYLGLFARRRRAGDAVGILMIDIDHFKRLNDRFGHATGDVVLKAVAGAIVSAVREDDVPARFGGEEFVVLLRNPGNEIAAEVGERVRQAVRRLDLSDLGVAGVTVSVGVSVASSPDRPIGELIEQADQALYRAKRAGRNRVVAA